jgi:uncharacterized protein YehS (DUF1456 family)
MNYDAFNYRIRMQLTEQELAQFRAAYAEIHNEVVEIFLEAEQHDGFQAANDVINRIRGR